MFTNKFKIQVFIFILMIMKLDSICRTCLYEKQNLKSLFDAYIPNMIMAFTSVQLLQGDGLPHQICTQCLRDVNKAYAFKQQCEKSDMTLRNYVSMNLNNNLNQLCDLSSQIAATDSDNILGSTNLLPSCSNDNIISNANIMSGYDNFMSNNILSNTNTDNILDLPSSVYNTNLNPNSFGATIDTNVINNMNEERNDFFGNSEVLQQSSFFQEIFNDPSNQSLVDNFDGNAINSAVPDLVDTMQSLQTIAEQCLPESWENDNQSCAINTGDATNNFNLVDNFVKCQFCENIFKDAWSLDEHHKNHNCQDKYFCSNITDELTKSMLLEYSFDTNSKDNFTFENIEPTNQNLLCDICDRTFTDQKYLKKHLKDIHFIDTTCVQERKHSCSICGKRYRQYKVLLLHMRTHTGERPLKCEICFRTFALPSSLRSHKKIHGQEKQYECHICRKKFNNKSNLNGHILTHSGEKPHICPTCGKGFATNTNLEIHKRLHTGVKPFVCTFCDKGFNSSTQLKKHMMVHTGEKPYACFICGQSFRRKETRDTHSRYHTGERPYSCKICQKKYIAASHLRAHMKSHNDDRKFNCMVCPKKFLDMKTLKSHILSHTGQKPYTCRYCGKGFVQNSGLNTHIKSCHSNGQ